MQVVSKAIEAYERQIASILEEFHALFPDSKLDHCSVQQLVKHVDKLTSELMELPHEILSIDEGEENLMDSVSTIEKASLDMSLTIQHLIHCFKGDLSDCRIFFRNEITQDQSLHLQG